MNIAEEKERIRKELKEGNRRLGAMERESADLAIRNALGALKELKSQDIVAGYVAMRDEVDLTPLLADLAERRVRICLPRSITASKGTGSPRSLRISDDAVSYGMAEVDPLIFQRNVLGEYLIEGMYGIPEPPFSAPEVLNSDVRVWLVPALAFDTHGNRLGRGGGFYDRFLSESGGVRIGVGYECRIVDELPCDDWDQRMDLIVTERRTIWIGEK